jgi:REP element-mobilizing transposase RayT
VVNCYVHCVFGTKAGVLEMDPDFQKRLWAYMGGIAKKRGIGPIAIGGAGNHVHLLLSMPATLSIAEAMYLIKGGSSRWANDEFAEYSGFAWQSGYGAFSVDSSRVAHVIAYINNQWEHHRVISFDDEMSDLARAAV